MATTGGLLAHPATKAAMQAHALAHDMDRRKEGVFMRGSPGNGVQAYCARTIPTTFTASILKGI